MSKQYSTSSFTQNTQGKSTNGKRDLEGDLFDVIGETNARLQWSESEESLIIKGTSDVAMLTGFKGALLKLKDEFFSDKEKVHIVGERK